MEGSWRTGVPQQVQDDLDDCFSFALDVALELVRKRGEFSPFRRFCGRRRSGEHLRPRHQHTDSYSAEEAADLIVGAYRVKHPQ